LLEFISQYGKGKNRNSLIDLSAAILEQMPYTPDSTGVMTTAAQAFDLEKGVCQDHAHVFLACARHLKLPARYVSGYLNTEDSSHLSTHAWAEVYLDGLWYCFDTSNQLFSPSHHVYLAVGRDYFDAAPVRGVRQGGGEESMRALVQVMAS
jgi:transglutaminase-like putative cysteine protease